ncbi:MAG: flagellin [Pseudooceanicola sp.]
MSSILTNNSAMVALQTLKSVNNSMSDVQSQISTGKRVSDAKDNAAVWAIAKVMESDVKGFKGISDSLALGESTVAVARSASETVTDLLTQMKGKIVAAQEDNVDREKIQTDIDALRDQIGAVVGAAQFNGLNLLSNTETDADSGSISVLSSLDRSATGVAVSQIGVDKQDLGTGASAIAATGGTFAADTGTSAVTLNGTQTGSIDIGTDNIGFDAGTAYALNIFGTDANDSNFTQADYRTSAAAASNQAEAAANDIRYVARDGDTAVDVAKGLQSAWAAYAGENGLDASVLDISATGDTLTFTSTVTDATDSIQVNLVSVTADAGNTIGGGLELLNKIDVTSADAATAALGAIEGLTQTAIDSAAAFGSVQGRIETQSNFIGALTDSLKSGIGTLVDAEMEEASARLQALQVQQQLAVQAMSIANQAPQTLLSLFR